MEFVSFQSIGEQAWDLFCIENDEAWFRHTATWLEYTCNMRENGASRNMSFGVVDHGKLIAIVPLIMEAIHRAPALSEFGFAGWNVPFPALARGLGEKHRDKIGKEIFQEIDRLANVHEVSYAAFEVNPLITVPERTVFACNPLPFLGFTSTDIATHIIGLDDGEDTLLRRMRKGHKSDITAGLNNNYIVRLFDSASIDVRAFDTYRSLHLHAAGRQTRPDKTWRIMYEWVRNGFAVLAILEHKKEIPIAAALSIVYKDAAYYGSGCVEPDFVNERGVMHVLLWETMRFLKLKMIRWFETGWQHTPTLSQEVPSQKEVNISHFKRGFGGMNVPYYRGEKFYNYCYMEEAFQNRLRQFKTEWLDKEHRE